jgi:catechol 2,3-dioxygenase-like lactoylglutathione lyase family enzyme
VAVASGVRTHITHTSTVIVPVADQDRAIEFYVDTLGFEKRAEFPYADGERWVEVAPPGATTTIALARDDGSAGIETRLALSTEDVEADHADLQARGVDVDEAIMREGDPVVHWGGAVLAGVPPMFLARDPDGNSLLIVQQV